jgi:hypothetical protein
MLAAAHSLRLIGLAGRPLQLLVAVVLVVILVEPGGGS